MSFFPYLPANADISETGQEHSLDHQVRDSDPALPQEVPRFVEHPNASVTAIIAELVPPSQISRENRHHLAQRNEELENQLEFERRQVELERQRRLQLEAQLGGPERAGENDDTRIPKCGCCSTGRVTRKRWIVACIAVVVLIMVCAVTVWATTSSKASPSLSPTISLSMAPIPAPIPGPRSEADALAIQDFINSKTFTKQPLSYPSQDTPGEQALQWLIDKDLSTDVSDTLSLLQRFVLGTLWFANGPFSDRFRNDTDTWLSPRDECQWWDILGCVNGEVTWLELNSNGLNGTIPADVGLLTALSRLWLSTNQLTGTIPSEIGGLTALTDLSLSRNLLTGSIPSQILSLTSLKFFYVNGNNLTGRMPFCDGDTSRFVFMLADCAEIDCSCCETLGNFYCLPN